MTLGERIKKIRKDADLTQQMFAEKIGSTQNVLANYETGRRNPSSSVINNICKTFNVNETWLRTGEGEMFVELPWNEALAAQIQTFLQGGTDSFRERLVSLLLRLSPEQWEALEGYLLELVSPRLSSLDAPPVQTSEASRAELEREADEFAAMARAQFLSEKTRELQASSAKESGGAKLA